MQFKVNKKMFLEDFDFTNLNNVHDSNTLSIGENNMPSEKLTHEQLEGIRKTMGWERHGKPFKINEESLKKIQKFADEQQRGESGPDFSVLQRTHETQHPSAWDSLTTLKKIKLGLAGGLVGAGIIASATDAFSSKKSSKK